MTPKPQAVARKIFLPSSTEWNKRLVQRVPLRRRRSEETVLSLTASRNYLGADLVGMVLNVPEYLGFPISSTLLDHARRFFPENHASPGAVTARAKFPS